LFLSDETIAALIELGAPPEKLARVLKLVERDVSSVSLPPQESKDERRRRLDRERKRRVRGSPLDPEDVRDQSAVRPDMSAQGAEMGGKQAEKADIPRVCVGDNNPNSEDTCSGGGVGGGARDGVTETNDWPEGDLAALLVEGAASPWLDPQKSPSLVISAGRIAAWKRRGASWRLHVLPVVTTLAKQHGEPISHWKFFEKAIGRAVQASREELVLPEGVVPLRPGGRAKSRDEQNTEAWDYAIARIAQDEQ